MNLFDLITQAQGGGAVRQLSEHFGLDEGQTQSAISALLPAITGAVQQNASSEGGLAGILNALQTGGHERYVDDPSSITAPETVQDGNGILGHLFGDKQVSRQVAAQAAEQTGIGPDVLKQMLPMVATLVMGGLSKQTARGAAPQQAEGGGLFGMLGSMLDRNGDGSAVDDVLGMASQFFRNR